MHTLTLRVHAMLLAVLLGAAAAHPAVILTTIDRSDLTVGDMLHMVISTIVPKGAKVVPPETDNGFGPITVKEWDMKKYELAGSDSVAFTYVLTTYIPEPCTIPALPYTVITNAAQDTLHSQAIPLKFISVITTDSAAIKGLKPQQEAGKAPPVWLWLCAAIAFLVLCFVGWRYLSGRFRKAKQVPPPKPPYEEAMEAIATLEARRYIEKGLIREFVFELSDIYKRYIERRYEINAAEFTTEEMLAWLGASGLDTKLRSVAEWFFRTSDPVKFAKLIPDDSTLERFVPEVRSFLDATRPVNQTVAGSTAPQVPPREPVEKGEDEKPAAMASSFQDRGA